MPDNELLEPIETIAAQESSNNRVTLPTSNSREVAISCVPEFEEMKPFVRGKLLRPNRSRPINGDPR